MGDIFNHGLYDTHILLKKTPFLEWESPRQQDKLVAGDVMNSSGSKLTYLYPITRVRSIEQILRTTVHGAFPIVMPVRASSIPSFPKTVKAQHTPQLYASYEEENQDSRSSRVSDAGEIQAQTHGNGDVKDDRSYTIPMEGIVV